MNRLHEGFVLGDRYRLESRIASGGMADVWAGNDEVLKRTVAIKIMRPDSKHEKLFALRFRDEAVHSAGLNHNNIATVFDYGEDDGLAYLVMELVAGEPVSAILRERGPLPPAEVRSILGQAALALAVAHEARVIHRDVKPANILVRPDGVVKLTDFGIARALDASGHTQHGEMLSGSRPFDRGTPIATALSHLNESPPPLPDDVPEDLAQVIQDCLQKSPTDRPPNAAAVAVRLGLGDVEVAGLALGLAQALGGAPEEALDPDQLPTQAMPSPADR